MSEPAPLPYDALPLPSKLRLHHACRDFEKAWRSESAHPGAAGPPELGPFLPEVPAAERLAFVQELVLLDLDYRRGGGYPCLAEDYLARFPELDRSWLQVAWAAGNGAEDTTVGLAGTPTAGESGAASPPPIGPEAAGSADGTAAGGLVSGEYEILEQLGRGGMGVVYKARQRRLNRLVALKVILAGEYASESSLRRFRVEAEAAARLQHEGVVRVYGVGTEAGRPHLVMEYVEGGSLKDRLDGIPWPCRQAAELVERLAWILQAAHAKGVVHRDLKPANVLLTPQGQVKVTDFGLARLLDEGSTLTQTGEVLGTPSYMAPEQARGASKGAQPAVDVYALGAILYELLTGRPPFRGATAADTLLQVVGDRPVPPSLLNSRVDRDLETVCLKCLEKDAGQRYASATALAEDLGRYREHRPVLARPPGWTDALLRGLGHRHWVAKAHWARTMLAIAPVALAIHAVAYWLVQTEQPKEVYWVSVGAFWLLVGCAFARCLGPRRREWTPAEGYLLSLWGGYALGTVVLWFALGMPYGRGLLTTYYPALAVLTGLAYLVQGSVYWGWFYLLGLAFFVLAVVMGFTPDWAPLEMGLLHGCSKAAFGWYLLREPGE